MIHVAECKRSCDSHFAQKSFGHNPDFAVTVTSETERLQLNGSHYDLLHY